jgi:hypothetical protein
MMLADLMSELRAPAKGEALAGRFLPIATPIGMANLPRSPP